MPRISHEILQAWDEHAGITEETVETVTASVTPIAAGDDNGSNSSKKRKKKGLFFPFINAIEHMATLIRTFLINSEEAASPEAPLIENIHE